MKKISKNCITLSAVGDIMLGDLPLCLGFGVASKIKEKGSIFIFKNVKRYLKGDIVFGNLEAVLSNKGLTKEFSSQWLRGEPESIKGLKYAGFNILSLSNNHILEHGIRALEETKKILKNNKIKYVDINPISIKIKNKKIGFVAFNTIPGEGASPILKNSEILKIVKKMKKRNDIVVVSIHWGNEYIQKPSQQQIKLGHKIIDEGADIILGHHPHVLQPIENYKGKIIAYSLGNFVFDMWDLPTRVSIILKINLENFNYKITDIIINKNYQPTPIKRKIKTPIKFNYKLSQRIHFIKNINMYPKRYVLYLLKKWIRKNIFTKI